MAVARAVYVGWLGHANLGDEVMWQATVSTLDAIEFVPMPLRPLPWLRRMAHPTNRRHVHDAFVFLGGGTTIGRSNWRLHLAQARAVAKSRPLFMWGAGVEDPRFHGRRSFSRRDELSRWRGVLQDFDSVTVRGPQSARLLESIGIAATVVGDPALLCGPEQAPAAAPDPVIGVNLGFGDDLFGGDQHGVVAAVTAAVDHFRARGWRVRWFAMNPTDVPWLRECAAGLGDNDPSIALCTTATEFAAAVGACRLVIAQRLHAAVLSAAHGIPVVVAEYQPKCRDFAESVELDDLCLSTQGLAAAALIERIELLVAHYEKRRKRLVQVVSDHRQRLRGAANHAVARMIDLQP